MKIIIHVGMNKTGSTAIQNYYYHNAPAGVGYIPWRSANHSALFVLLFQEMEKLEEYHGFRIRGRDFMDTLPELRQNWLKKVSRYLEEFSGDTVVFSAEGISQPGFTQAAENMVEFFRAYTTDIRAVGYVREARSFAVSAFQQRLKGIDKIEFNPSNLWPLYRERFQGLDAIFGKDNITLKAYEKRSLDNGNIVADFSKEIGLDIKPNMYAEANTSLSAEATALLFTQKTLGSGLGEIQADTLRKNEKFIDLLSVIGRSRFDFSDNLWSPVAAKHADDLRWMEERLGHEFCRSVSAGKIEISSEEDLLDLALASAAEARASLHAAVERMPINNREELARLLNLLRSLG